MLMIAIVALVAGSIYAAVIAPPAQRALVLAVLIALTVAGYVVGLMITNRGTDERTYYPIATAIGGTAVAFGWISHKRKSWPKRDERQ